ncbi:MAG: hypothetical protein IKT40_01120 [Bacilli bacterium]|nr:hypothetical protein [Bacilli bacterium]
MILYSKNLLMEQKDEIDADKILPIEWGTLKSFGVSVGPDDEKHTDDPKRSFCFVTDKGAFAVSCNYSSIIPTKEEILSANFVEGSFDNKYNGAFYTTTKNSATTGLKVNGWYPAKYEQWEDRIVWLYGDTVVRNVRNTTLSLWGWKNEYLTIGNNYTYKITDNKMLIYCLDKLVLTLY